jgi:chromosome partitioning protein
MKIAKIIAIINQKGGVGKTLVARTLAHALTLRGFKVLLLDADPQGSLFNWSQRSDIGITVIQAKEKGSIAAYVKEFKNNYDYIIIDGKPSLEENKSTLGIVEIVKEADLAVLPLLSSQDDFDSTNQMLELISARKELTGKPDYFLLQNRYDSNQSPDKTIFDVINQSGYPKLTPLPKRNDFHKETGEGGTVYCSQERSAKEAVTKFDIFVNELLEKIKC